ncbi:MAG: DNA repair protein RecN [Chitinispirillaceae bacterium]|nr:DNA repair protein RecN [Chitinispirillaceae bacterium]
MIQELHIKNLALIDELSLELEDGLTIFTGETGAGKSILLGAIGLLLGERASADMIRSGFDEATVSATFCIKNISSAIIDELNELAIVPEENQLIIRRKITRSDRNKIYINQIPIPLGTLKKLGDRLIDLHGQHEHQSLLNEETHISVIDALPGVSNHKAAYDEAFRELEKAQSELESHCNKTKKLLERKDFLEYQLKEIHSIDPHPGEEEKLETELSLLSSGIERSTCTSEIMALLSGNSESILKLTARLRKKLDTLSKYDSSVEAWCEELDNANSVLNELDSFCSSYLTRIEEKSDPSRIEYINSRLSKIQRLKKKYSATLEQLVSLKVNLEKDLEDISNSQSDASQLQHAVDSCNKRCMELGKILSEERRKAATDFDLKISALISRLGITDGRLITVFNPLAQPSSQGLETIRFFSQTNPGEPHLPLSKSASGGEISRIMLAIKTVLAENDNIPVLIFDEIDTGIGGLIASEVGSALQNLSKSHQVLCISHLHQVASMGDHHFKVYKTKQTDRTVTLVEKLDRDGRVAELARMLGGVSDITIKHAESLLDNSSSPL